MHTHAGLRGYNAYREGYYLYLTRLTSHVFGEFDMHTQVFNKGLLFWLGILRQYPFNALLLYFGINFLKKIIEL